MKPWWRTDASGAVVMSLYHGTKPIEFERARPPSLVGSRDKLPGVIDARHRGARAR